MYLAAIIHGCICENLDLQRMLETKRNAITGLEYRQFSTPIRELMYQKRIQAAVERLEHTQSHGVFPINFERVVLTGGVIKALASAWILLLSRESMHGQTNSG